MRVELAERLLAKVMGWDEGEVGDYIPLLQTMARYKYDSYQQFAPGMRFTESLALWLGQFAETDLRNAAFEFVLHKLVFFSNSEMNHFVKIAYQDYILPTLRSKAAGIEGMSPYKVSALSQSATYLRACQQSLFVGLSDGARTDVFRRHAAGRVSNEQVFQSYDFGPIKAGDFRKQLGAREPGSGEASSDTVFLLDDFCGSGYTYMRQDPETGEYKGKIPKFFKALTEEHLVSDDADVHLVIYVASDKACDYLTRQVSQYLQSEGKANRSFHIKAIQTLSPSIAVNGADPLPTDLALLIDRYYDPVVNNDHMRVGGADGRYGFADCGLPVVLSHNTPNNSIFLLWANQEQYKVHGLFPRISRHQ